MAWRTGLGPVLAVELRVAARRRQTYALHPVFVAALRTAFGCVGRVDVGDRRSVRVADMAASTWRTRPRWRPRAIRRSAPPERTAD